MKTLGHRTPLYGFRLYKSIFLFRQGRTSAACGTGVSVEGLHRDWSAPAGGVAGFLRRKNGNAEFYYMLKDFSLVFPLS